MPSGFLVELDFRLFYPEDNFTLLLSSVENMIQMMGFTDDYWNSYSEITCPLEFTYIVPESEMCETCVIA